jgi:hypothetical protein
MGSLSEAALAFARECLNRQDSRQIEDEIQTGPEFNLGPPGYLDASSFVVYDLQRIMQMVTAWCQTHGLDISLRYFDQTYTCQIIVSDDETGKLSEVIEFSDHEVVYESFAPCVDACYVLLGACVEARRTVKRIIRHYDPLR